MNNQVSDTDSGESLGNCIGGVLVSVLTSSAVDRGLEPQFGQPKDYKIYICHFSSKHTAVRRKSRLVGSESE